MNLENLMKLLISRADCRQSKLKFLAGPLWANNICVHCVHLSPCTIVGHGIKL